MVRTFEILAVSFLLLTIGSVVFAAPGGPTEQTTFNFQRGGEPAAHPVEFTVECYGGNKKTDNFEKVSNFTETCEEYGCSFNTTAVFHFPQKSIEYCNVKGSTNQEDFFQPEFLERSVKNLDCSAQDYDIAENDKYYKKTQEYKKCRAEVYQEYYPKGEGKAQGRFVCDEYKQQEDLIPTDISTEPNGPCYKYGYTIKNDTCYKIPQEFFDCTDEKDRKLEKCDKHLRDVTHKIAEIEGEIAYDQLCEVTINLPEFSEEESKFKPLVFTKRLFGVTKCFLVSLFTETSCYDLK